MELRTGKKVSVTELIQWFKCARAWYLQRVLKAKGEPVIYFVIGSAVHNFIDAYMHNKKTPRDRVFFYKSLDSAKKAFTRYWIVEVTEKYKHDFSEGTLWWAHGKGQQAIENYYKLAVEKGHLTRDRIEKRLSIYVPELGVTLHGVIDQIRATVLEWAAERGLPKDGVVVLDLKTGFPGFGAGIKNPTSRDLSKAQTALLNNVQATMYYFLVTRVLEVPVNAVVFWFLGGDAGKIVVTRRDDSYIPELFKQVETFLDGINKPGIPPKTPDTYACKYCQFWSNCWEEKDRPKIEMPLEATDTERPTGTQVLPPEKPKPLKQLRLKLAGVKRKNKVEN